MKQKVSSEENSQSRHTVEGPGSQLRKARERQGLDLPKVAAQLHLNQSMVHALEWDDYEHLPAAVFVQGYLRKYARLLGIDEDAVILTYQELHPDAEQQPLPRNQPDEVALELHNEHRLVRYIVWGSVLVIGVVIFFWWQGRMDSSVPPTSPGDEREVIEPDFPSAEGTGLRLPPQEQLPAIDNAPMESAPAAVISPSATTSESMPLPSSTVTPAASEPVQETLAMPENRPPVMPGERAAVEQEPTALGESTSAAATASGLVVFEFTGPCWVEVRDASGRARILGVMRTGVRRSLDARQGPFRIVIGDIYAARLSVRGEAYDLRRHARGKVARFTLDPSRL